MVWSGLVNCGGWFFKTGNLARGNEVGATGAAWYSSKSPTVAIIRVQRSLVRHGVCKKSSVAGTIEED